MRNQHRRAIILITVLFVFTCFFGILSPSVEAAKKKIGVTKFDANFTVRLPRGGYYDIGTGATDMLTNELVKNKNYEVMERAQLAQVMQEQRLGATGAVDDSTAAQMGKLVGLDYIVYGRVLSAGAELKEEGMDFGKFSTKKEVLEAKVMINVRMIDANTGAIVVSQQAKGVIEKKGGGFTFERHGQDYGHAKSVAVTSDIYDDAVLQAIKQIASKINDINPLEGTVVSIAGDDIYLDIGTEQGIEPGAKLQIYREGKPIRNASGMIIGVQKQQVCTVVVKNVDGNMSICEIQLSKKERKGGKEPLIRHGDKARLL
jgi:curli biogenesis system outer membrane secretion channel CsgG